MAPKNVAVEKKVCPALIYMQNDRHTETDEHNRKKVCLFCCQGKKLCWGYFSIKTASTFVHI